MSLFLIMEVLQADHARNSIFGCLFSCRKGAYHDTLLFPSYMYQSSLVPYQSEYHIKISEAMIPISTDTLYYCAIQFDLSKLVTTPLETFDGPWSYVGSVYIKLYGTVCVLH